MQKTLFGFGPKVSGLLSAALAAVWLPLAAAEEGDIPALNWDAAPVDIVLQAYGEQLDKTILKDPGVPGATITLKSREGQRLTRAEYLEAIEVVLEMNGVHLEPYGEKFIRALPRAKVRKEGIPLIMDSETRLAESGRVVSMMIPFKHVSAQDEAQKALESFKSDSGVLFVIERTNSILVTDTEQNINRMLEIAKTIDVATPILENVFVRQIRNATAADIKTALEAIVQESQKELEKAGKGVQNAQSNAGGSSRPAPSSRLLGRGGQNQPQQAAAPVSTVMSVSDADRGMIRGKVLILSDERSNKLIIVTQKTNMDFFDKVIEQLDVETTPDTVVKVYRLKYADSEEVSDMINDLIGNGSSKGSKDNANPRAKTGANGNLSRGGAAGSKTALNAQRASANQRTGEAKAGELTKDNTTVLADKRINGLVVMTRKELVPVLEQIIESMDVKLSQVLIETVIIEVSLGDDLKTGVDWVKLGQKQETTTVAGSPITGANGLQMYHYTDGEGNVTTHEDVGTSYKTTDSAGVDTTWTKIGEGLSTAASTVINSVSGGFWGGRNGDLYAIGGGGGDSNAADALYSIASGVATNLINPTGTGLNLFLKSDRLNLGAVIKASKTDSRANYLASPIIMTVDNKEATIDATEMRYLFKGYQYSGSSYNGSPVPDYEQKEIGIKIKVKPKINPNGTVMLNVEEEYSQEGDKQNIEGATSSGAVTQFGAATTITRKMTADVLLDNMQTVVLGGLTQKYVLREEKGIPILKDIPYIGKWLFGYTSEAESRKELLVFMTPYVLDDAGSAQAEALRRKKALSDTRAWSDNGWSLSELADPVSKKEMLRRLKDEWRKQDEERKTKLSIEAEKIKRAKALKNMSKEERDFWLEMHKEELEEEEQEAFEAKMLDEKSQDALRKLATQIRRDKMREANASIREADDAARQENARGRLEAEKRGETPAGDEPELERLPEAKPAEVPAAAAESEQATLLDKLGGAAR